MTPLTRRGAGFAALCLSAGTVFAQTPERVPIASSAVAASTHDAGNLSANTVDGSLASRWSGYGDGAWISYDLGTARSIENVRIAVYRGNERRNQFDLQVSDTGDSWVTVWEGVSSSGTTTGFETFILWGARGRYLRYVGHGYTGTTTGSGLWNSIIEVEVYAHPEPLTPPTGLRPQTGNGRVLLTWNTVAGAHSYEVRRRVADCGPDAVIAQVPAQAGALQSYLNTTVTEGVRYFYTVSAQTSSGSSEPSAPVAVTPARSVPSITKLTAVAGAPGSNRVNLSWEPVFTATRYVVYRASESASCVICTRTPFSLLTTVTAPAIQYVDTTATPGRNYFYRVVAANDHGSGETSNIARVLSSYATPTPRPTAPTPRPCTCAPPTPSPAPITAPPTAPVPTLTPGSGKVRIEWYASGLHESNRATGYTVLRGEAACGPFQKVAQLASSFGGPATFIDSGLTNGRTYYYLVVGTNPLGDSTNATGLAVTPMVAAPPAPQGVNTYVHHDPSPFAVVVFWDEVWDAESYTVRRSGTSGGPYTTIATGVVKQPGHSAVTYNDPNVQYQTSYYYVVTAVNSVGESSLSAEAAAHTGPPPLPPGDLTATPTGNAGEVRLSWDAPPGAISYSCQHGVQPGGPYDVPIGIVYAPETTTLVSMLTNEIPQYFVCTAYGVNGRSGNSNEASAVPAGTLSPPANLVVREVTSPTRRCLQPSWHRVSGAASYHVWRAVGLDNEFRLFGNTPDMYIDDCTVELDTAYSYYVTAYTELAESGPSATVSGRLPGETLVTPPRSAVTASTHDGNLPANTVDNNLATRWSANGDGQWIQWDLGTVRTVSSVRIAAYRGNERKNRFDILGSQDGATWTVLGVNVFGSGTTNAQETYDLFDTPARYIRYVGHGARLNAGGTSTWNSVTEVDIYAMP